MPPYRSHAPIGSMNAQSQTISLTVYTEGTRRGFFSDTFFSKSGFRILYKVIIIFLASSIESIIVVKALAIVFFLFYYREFRVS